MQITLRHGAGPQRANKHGRKAKRQKFTNDSEKYSSEEHSSDEEEEEYSYGEDEDEERDLNALFIETTSKADKDASNKEEDWLGELKRWDRG